MTAAPQPDWTADWQAILAPLLRPGETLLWQGAPQPGFHQPGKRLLLMAVGLPFLLGGLVLFFTALLLPAAPGTEEWAFSLFLAAFALVFAGIGVFLTLGPLIEARHAATRLRYALTTRAAYILSHLVTDRVQVFPILASTPLDLDPVPGAGSDIGTVWFHARPQRDSEGDAYIERIGFQNIADARHVYHLIRNLQEAAT